jgi:hypothetical protein
LRFGDTVFGRRDAESGVKRIEPAKARRGSPFEVAALPGRQLMAEFRIFLIFLGVTGLTYSLLSLRRSDPRSS